jgi:hypothetical protein
VTNPDLTGVGALFGALVLLRSCVALLASTVDNDGATVTVTSASSPLVGSVA